MAVEKDKIKRQISYYLDKNYVLEKNLKRHFEFTQYSRGLHGKHLKITSIRRVLDFEQETLHLYYQDSREIEIGGSVPGHSMISSDLISYHDAILIKPKTFLPEVAIRPNSIREKLANLVLRFDVKLNNRKEFNSKYILESSSPSEILETLLSKAVTDEIVLHKSIMIDFKNQGVLLRFDEEVDKENSIILMKLAKLIHLEL